MTQTNSFSESEVLHFSRYVLKMLQLFFLCPLLSCCIIETFTFLNKIPFYSCASGSNFICKIQDLKEIWVKSYAVLNKVRSSDAKTRIVQTGIMQVIQHYIQVWIHAYVRSNQKKKLYVTCSTHLIAQRESDRLKIRLDIWEKRRTASQFLRLLGLRKSSGCWIAWRNLSRVFNRILTRDFDRSFPFNFQSIRWFSLAGKRSSQDLRQFFSKNSVPHLSPFSETEKKAPRNNHHLLLCLFSASGHHLYVLRRELLKYRQIAFWLVTLIFPGRP